MKTTQRRALARRAAAWLLLACAAWAGTALAQASSRTLLALLAKAPAMAARLKLMLQALIVTARPSMSSTAFCRCRYSACSAERS